MANSTALDIANMFSDSFETVVAIETFDKAVLQATGLSSNKIICEICLFFHLAHDVIATRRSLLAKVERFITESREYVLDSKTMSYIERFPAGVHLVGLILLCSNTYNLKSQRLELLEQAIRSPAYLCAERLPFRYQESVWLYEQITSQALHDQNCRSALLSRITHPSVLSRNDLYAKTHTVMYETNFGRRYISEPYDNSAIKLSMCHDLNLSFCNADWDLVGEICMANRFLGNFHLPSAQCLNALHAVFLNFGFIPSITFDAEHAPKLRKQELGLYTFVHSYHSTLVYGLLLACGEDKEEYSSDDECDNVDAAKTLEAIARVFGNSEFSSGPLSMDWYATDVSVSLEALIDGYASKCYWSLGKKRALEFIDSIPGAPDLEVVKHTRQYLESI